MKTGKGQLVCLSRLVVAAHAFVLRFLHGGFRSPAVPHAFAVPIQGSLSSQTSGESMPPGGYHLPRRTYRSSVHPPLQIFLNSNPFRPFFSTTPLNSSSVAARPSTHKTSDIAVSGILNREYSKR